MARKADRKVRQRTLDAVGVGPSFVCPMADTEIRGGSRLHPEDGPCSVGKIYLGLPLGYSSLRALLRTKTASS